ncbi:MAG: SIS domain-containing protein [Clostridia bacterium]|nr:SIS domain-containing protein [Clostridia bacterium]
MLNELLNRYPSLFACKETIQQAAEALIRCYADGKKVMTCGNGGSCADADHIVGELMKGFLKNRPIKESLKNSMKEQYPSLDANILDKLQCGLPALSLCSLTALNTAICNDTDPNLIYAQSVFGLGNKGDVLICISTSGNAKTVCAAAQVAKALGILVIGLTGSTGGKLKEIADICICAPETETYKIQELHLPIYHYLCAAVEAYFFDI